MSSNLKLIETDSQLMPELTSAGTKLVVVDFFATWCGPCINIAPVFEQLAAKYPKAMFLKVDVDKCQEVAASNGVTAMPTFLFFRNKTKIDSMRGADAGTLEEKIRKWYGSGAETEEDETLVKGHMDLVTFIEKNGCECLNESDEHTLTQCLTTKEGYLESDCDEQLIVMVTFNQVVKLHSLKIAGPADKGPKTVKLFINQPKSLDFDSAESMACVQTLELNPDDIHGTTVVPLRYVKFQNVSNITLFVKDNQGGTETTQINHLSFIGTPVAAVNMNEFKRVAGKKGESE